MLALIAGTTSDTEVLHGSLGEAVKSMGMDTVLVAASNNAVIEWAKENGVSIIAAPSARVAVDILVTALHTKTCVLAYGDSPAAREAKGLGVRVYEISE